RGWLHGQRLCAALLERSRGMSAAISGIRSNRRFFRKAHRMLASNGSISLDQYATVCAVLAEGWTLDDALASADLERQAWQRCELAWTRRLIEDAACFEAYRAALAKAEDRMSRRVTPLDNNAAAWVSFLGALAGAMDPASLFEQHGLNTNDLA